MRGKSFRSARMAGSSADSAGNKKCKPNTYKLGKLYPLVSEEGRLLERHNLPHQRLCRMIPNTLVDVSEQTRIAPETRVVIKELFDGAQTVPDWLLSGFEPMDELYRGGDFYYVWYPLDLNARPATDRHTTYRVYTALVNRIDAMERLIQHKQLPLDVRRALVMFQDMHQMLCLFMTVYAVFCDQELELPAVFGTLDPVMETLDWALVLRKRRDRVLAREQAEDTLDNNRVLKESVMARASVWAQYRHMGEDCETLDSVPDEMREFRADCKNLFANRKSDHDGSFLDVFYPSYEFVFHEGELPDLSVIVRHSGLFGEETLSDIPFEDPDMLSLRNLIAKSLPLPMRPREIDAICAERCEENELVNYCMQRMTFATLGGYYGQCTPTSFYVRNFLYRWFQFCPPYLDQFCSWLYGHKRMALDGKTVIDVIHKELVLHIIKEYLVNIVYQMPDVSEHLSKYRWFGEMTFEMHEALETMRETIDDSLYGNGERWLRFERRYFKYVSEHENQRISHNLKPRLGDFWNSRNKRVCTQKPLDEDAQKRDDIQQFSATITRDKLPRGNINVYPMPKKRKKPRVNKQHKFTAQLQRVYEQTLKDLPVERMSARYSPDALFGPEVVTREDGTITGGVECDPADLQAYAEEDAEGDIENKSVEDVYDMMMRKIERAKNKRSAAIKAASKSVKLPIVLPTALCNSILRIIMDPISDRIEDMPHLTRERFQPLADMLQISIEWFGRLGTENCTPLDLVWDVVCDRRRWDVIQYALDFKLEHRSAPFVSYDCRTETEEQYRTRWFEAVNTLAEELTDKGLQLANTAINGPTCNSDEQVDSAYAQWDEETRRLMIRQFLRIYTGNPRRPVNEDHRSVYSQLHGVSLVWNPSARCMCPRCMYTDKISNAGLYREFQETVCGQDAAVFVFQEYTTTLCNAILRDVYDKKTIKYLYRTTSQCFVQHLVEQMWIASETFKTNATFQKALAAIREDELRFITMVVSRLPRWMPVSMEWLACPPLSLHWSPIAVLRWARVMYESNTYTIDLRSSVREMITVFPREFILIQHMFVELHARRSAILYKLPHAIAQQQYDTMAKKFGIDSARGDLIPPIAYEYYYCPMHGDVKRALARNDVRITTSYGHTNVAYNPRTNCVECSLNFQRSKAKAHGPIHRMRRLHAKLRYIAHVYTSALQSQPRHRVALQAVEHKLLDMVELVQRAGMANDATALRNAEQWVAERQRVMKRDEMDIDKLAQELLESLSDSRPGKQLGEWLRVQRDPVLAEKMREQATKRKRRNQRPDDEAEYAGAGQADSSKAMLRNMADLQCGGPLPKVNLLGRLFHLNGRLYMLCPYCLTLMMYTRESHTEFGVSCNLCMSTLKNTCPRNLSEFVRVVCYQCGDNSALERPEDCYMYVLLDDTEIGRRSERAVYLCRKHYKTSLCRTGEVMGVTAARKYMKMQVKRVGVGDDPLNQHYVLVDMAENNNIMRQRSTGQLSRGSTRNNRFFYVWSMQDKMPQYRIKMNVDVPTDVTQRALEVLVDLGKSHGVNAEQLPLNTLLQVQQKDAAMDEQDAWPSDAEHDVVHEVEEYTGGGKQSDSKKNVIDWRTLSHTAWDVSLKTPGVNNYFLQLDKMEARSQTTRAPSQKKRVPVRKTRVLSDAEPAQPSEDQNDSMDVE